MLFRCDYCFRPDSIKAGNLPSVDVVRVKDGHARAVNILEGDESEDVSARAKGFLSMLKSFQEKVSACSRPDVLVCTRDAMQDRPELQLFLLS